MILRGVALPGVGFSIPKRLDGSLVTSGTVTVYLTKDGGTQSSTTTVTHEGNGQYTINLSASDLDCGVLTLLPTHADGTGAPITIVTAPWVSGVAQSGGASTITLASGASATDNMYVGLAVHVVSGTGAGQARIISSYMGTTKVATVDRTWATNPDATSVYVLLPAGADLRTIAGAAVATGSAQLGVNVVNFGGSAGTFAAGRPEVNTTHAAGTAWGSGAITAASIASGAITSAKIATNAIGASQLATDAIGSAQLAATAITEIQSGLATSASIAALNDIAAADVWAAGTRTLTAGTNIALAKGTGITGFNDLSAADVRTAVGLASANLDTQLDALPTAAEIFAAVATTALTEAYAADGAAPTLAQAIFAIQQRLTEFAISGTTITVKKLDGSTTAMTLTLDDATTPTSSTRSG